MAKVYSKTKLLSNLLIKLLLLKLCSKFIDFERDDEIYSGIVRKSPIYMIHNAYFNHLKKNRRGMLQQHAQYAHASTSKT